MCVGVSADEIYVSIKVLVKNQWKLYIVVCVQVQFPLHNFEKF